jgi:hypothetical protein
MEFENIVSVKVKVPSAQNGIPEYSKWNSGHSVPMGIVVYCHKGITSSRAL